MSTSARALWAYETSERNELPFKAGDIIAIKQKHNADWWEGELMGKSGFFPANRVEEIEPPKVVMATKPKLSVSGVSSDSLAPLSLNAARKTSSTSVSIVVPGILPAPGQSSNTLPRTSISGGGNKLAADALNNALMARMSIVAPDSIHTSTDDLDSDVDDDGELTNLEPPSQAEIRKEGLMQKKCESASKKSSRSFKQVHVELSTSGILYFYKEAPNKKKLDKRDSPISAVELRGCSVDIPKPADKKKFIFQMTTGRDKIYQFQVSSEAECQSWMDLMAEESKSSSSRPLARQESKTDNNNRGRADSKASTVSKTGTDAKIKSKQPTDEEPKEKRGLFGTKSKADTAKTKKKSTDEDDPNMTEEQRRANAKSKLFSFFKSRPTADVLKDRGIIREDVMIFGGSLEVTAKKENRNVPFVVEHCIKRVELKGMDCIGVYRLSGNASTIQKLRYLYNEDASLVDLADEEWFDINVVTGTLKLYFRELQNPLMTYDMYSSFVEAAKITDTDQRLKAIQSLVKKLPSAHYTTLEFLIRHLQRVAKASDVNKMEVQNLAIVFGPTLLRPLVDSFDTVMNMGHQNSCVETIIASADMIFK